MDRTRIACLHYPAAEPQLAKAAGLWDQVDALRALLRRHLPPVTASLFARARPLRGQSGPIAGPIEWYSDLAGEPIPLDDLSDAERSRVLALVGDRLGSVRQLAEQLAASTDLDTVIQNDPVTEGSSSQLLQRAAHYLHPSCIYVIAGEPVLTYWGLEAPRRMPRNPKPVAVLPNGSDPSPRRRPLLLGLAAALAIAVVVALGLGGWHWYQQRVEQGLAAELAASLAAQCEQTAILQSLRATLEQIDPDGERFPEIWADTQRELDRCADAADLETLLAAASADCSAVPAVADALAYQDTSRPPFDALQARLSALQARCNLAEELDARLHSLDGDCDGILALAREHPGDVHAGYPVAEPLAAIATAAAACRIAADLGPRIAQARGDCQALRALERQLGQRRLELSEAMSSANPSAVSLPTPGTSAAAGADPAPDTHSSAHAPSGSSTTSPGDSAQTPSALLSPAREPLAALQAELDYGLERCTLADHLTARLAEAQGDCVELASLRETVARQSDQGPPFADLVARLDEALGQCAALNDLETRFVEAQGDCAAVKILSNELDQWRDNLRFVDIRARVSAEEAVCAEASALEQRIAAAETDCDALRALADEVDEQTGSPFAAARRALQAKLERCAIRERLTRLVDAAGTHCGRLKAAQREIARESGKDLASIRQRLTKALEPCRPKPVIAKPPRGAGTYALSGSCNGSLIISPAGGYHRDPVRHIVRIAPPVNARIAKVVSDNRGCRNCRLRKRNATTWSVQLYYGCSGRGSVPIAYSAYDQSGKLVCSGRGEARCLGRRRP